MYPRPYFLEDYLTELSRADSLHSRFSVYSRAAEELGYEGVSYTYIPHAQMECTLPPAPVFECNDAFSSDFIDFYSTKGMVKDDFTVRMISHRVLNPLDWYEHENNDLTTQNEKKLIRIARKDFNIVSGLSIPTASDHIGMGGASFTNTDKNRSFTLLNKESLRALQTISHLFNGEICGNNNFPYEFILPFVEQLRPKEARVLSYLMSGGYLKQINDFHNDITPKYASNLLDGLRRRMGGVTRDRLMSLLGKLDIIHQPDPGLARKLEQKK